MNRSTRPVRTRPGPRRGWRSGPAVLLGLFIIAGVTAAGALLLRVSGSDGVVLTNESEYVEGVAGTWQRVNPLFASANDVDADLSALVFSGLMRLGPLGDPVPSLAEGYPEITEDGRVYTFRLREGLTWHDDAPLTARDVAFTIARVKEPGFPGDEGLAAAWQSVEVSAPDDRTVVMRLQAAYAPFLARNATLGVLPEHILAGKSAAQLYDDPFNQSPVGSGPYRLESLNSQEAVLSAFGDYALGGPSIDTVRLVFFADYPAAVRAMHSGSLDGLYIADSSEAGLSAELDTLEGFEQVATVGTNAMMLYLNNEQGAIFGDPHVRRAISIALDRTAIAQEVFFSLAIPSASQVSPASWAYAREYDLHSEADIDEARRLLSVAGWVQHPTSGVLIREGAEFRFTIRTDTDPTRAAVAAAIARELDPLGIKVSVASTPFSVLRRDFLQERKYEAAVVTWDQGPDPDPYPSWHSSQMGSAGLNLANFADAIVDELVQKARITTDTSVRGDLYKQFQEKWDELAPSIVVAYPERMYVRRSSIDVPEMGLISFPSQRFGDIHEWSR